MMTTEHGWPTWAYELFETVCGSIESKGLGRFQGAYYDDVENRIEVAPVLVELSHAGPNDGKAVWALVHHVDVLAIQEAFDQVDAVVVLLDNEDGSPEFSVEGVFQGQQVWVTIYV